MTGTSVRIINKSRHALPAHATSQSAGVDLRANLNETIELASGAYRLIPTGLYIALPAGSEAQIRPRSGLAFKHGITVLNAPGTIDADYRGEIGVLLINHGSSVFRIEDGDRIAQMIVAKYEQVNWSEEINLDESERGKGGFGHTGSQ